MPLVPRTFLLLLLITPLLLFTPLLPTLDAHLPSLYRFSPEKLQQISQKAIANNPDDIDALLREIVRDLRVEYPGIVEEFDERRWVFNVAGGATGSMMILHASITEYLIFFGSASGTEGHSGAHLAHDYFTILSGKQTAGFLGELRPRVYMPGDQHHHPRFQAAHYKLENSTWALELAQGIIPTMLPFGLIQMPLSLDFDSTLRTVWYTGRCVVGNLLGGKV